MNDNIIIYSCLTGGYDSLIEQPKHSRVRYIFYTDLPQGEWPKKSNWEFRAVDPTVGKNNHFINRYYKMHPHVIFPDREYSLYIDANILINDIDYIVNLCDKHRLNNDLIALCQHPDRSCIYDECLEVLAIKKDTQVAIANSLKFLSEKNYPINNGLYEMGMMWRYHSNINVIKTMDLWWEVLNYKGYSQRDQLSFMVCREETKLKITLFPYNETALRDWDKVSLSLHNNWICKSAFGILKIFKSTTAPIKVQRITLLGLKIYDVKYKYGKVKIIKIFGLKINLLCKL